MPRISGEEAYPPANKKDSNRSRDVKTLIGRLAQLASGMDDHAWKTRNRKGYHHGMDAAGRRAVRWKDAADVMLGPWRDLQCGAALPVKLNIAEWLRNKYSTLTEALREGAILPIDVLDAVVRNSFFTASGSALLQVS